MTYLLIQSTIAHDGPVRCICIGPTTGEIVTGCQSDSPSMRRWRISEDFQSLEEIGSPIYHDHWVTAVASQLADANSPRFQEGCIVSGCMDSIIRVFDVNGLLQSQLKGHSKGVISFSWVPSVRNHLISGSWDGQAILWDIYSERALMRFGPHENGVHVLAVSPDVLISTSTGESVDGKPANYQIRFWNLSTGQPSAKPLKDHGGSIRSISALPGVEGFITSSNDGSVMMRGTDGQPIEQVFHAVGEDGTPPFVLDCCALNTEVGMDFVSCGEDGSLCVWSGAELVQSIPHPSTVWTALALPAVNTSEQGSFVTGCHDGYLRVFAKNRVEYSNNAWILQLNQNFQEEVVEKQRARSQGPSAEEISKAAKWENRGSHTAGKKENDVMVFNRDGVLIAAQFNSGAWVVIGEVTGKGDGGHIDGVWFDHVMPVEIETATGLKNLQLGYNNGENPFVAAQRFIDMHGMPQVYLSQIADWIQQRAGKNAGPSLDMASTAAGGTSPMHSGSNNSYNNNASSFAAMPSQSKNMQLTSVIDGYMVFDELPNQSKLLSKLQELNTEAMANQGVSLDANSLIHIERTVQILWETSRYHSSEMSSLELQSVFRLSQCFSLDKQFIAYDLLRLLVLHPHAATSLAASPAPVITALTACVRSLTEIVTGAVHSTPSSSSSSAVVPQNTLLTMSKFAANVVRSDILRRALYQSSPSLMSQLAFSFAAVLANASVYASCSKNVRLALLAVPFNYLAATCVFRTGFEEAVMASDVSTTNHAVSAIVQATFTVLFEEKETETVVLRAVQCLETLLKYRNEGNVLVDQLSLSVEKESQLLSTWAQASSGVLTALKEIVAVLGTKR